MTWRFGALLAFVFAGFAALSALSASPGLAGLAGFTPEADRRVAAVAGPAGVDGRGAGVACDAGCLPTPCLRLRRAGRVRHGGHIRPGRRVRSAVVPSPSHPGPARSLGDGRRRCTTVRPRVGLRCIVTAWPAPPSRRGCGGRWELPGRRHQVLAATRRDGRGRRSVAAQPNLQSNKVSSLMKLYKSDRLEWINIDFMNIQLSDWSKF